MVALTIIGKLQGSHRAATAQSSTSNKNNCLAADGHAMDSYMEDVQAPGRHNQGQQQGSHRAVTGQSGSHRAVTGQSQGSHRAVTGQSQAALSSAAPCLPPALLTRPLRAGSANTWPAFRFRRSTPAHQGTSGLVLRQVKRQYMCTNKQY
jgi:hypothetical protein